MITPASTFSSKIADSISEKTISLTLVSFGKNVRKRKYAVVFLPGIAIDLISFSGSLNFLFEMNNGPTPFPKALPEESN